MKRRVSLLCVGNEVVDGQITNTNARWLSEELDRLGFSIEAHLVVRDSVNEIVRFLQFSADFSDLIILVGGLGPTRDDLTRNGVAQWINRPLELHQASWDAVQDKLTKRKVPVREGHRQQALFPKGSTPLVNNTGVAPGFALNTEDGKKLVCLPGPPNELQDVFLNQLKGLLVQELMPTKDLHLKTWLCLGAAESEIAHIVESLLGTEVEVGFRLHRPYVEVKVWLPESPRQEVLRRLQTMEDKLAPWFVGHSLIHIRENFHEKLSQYKLVCVVDHVSGGLLLDKLREYKRSPHLRYQCNEAALGTPLIKEDAQQVIRSLHKSAAPDTFWLSLLPAGSNSAWIGFQDKIQLISTPERLPLSSEIGKLYVIEKCFLSL